MKIENTVRSFAKEVAWTYRYYLASLIILALLAGFLGIAVDYKIKEIIDSIAINAGESVGYLVGLFVVYKFLYHGIFFVDRLLSIRYKPRILESVILSAYSRIIQHSLHWFDSHMAGEISQKLIDLQDSILELFSLSFSILRSAITLIVMLVFLGQIHVVPMYVILGFMLIYIPVLSVLLRLQMKLQQRRVEARQETSGVINDSISNIFSVKTIGNADNEIQAKLEPAVSRWRFWERKTRLFDALAVDNLDTLLGVAHAGLQIYLVASLYQSGEISAGGFAFVAMMTLKVNQIIETLLDSILFQINPAIAQLKSSYNFIAQPLDVEDKSSAKTLEAVRGSIKFDNVTFTYGAENRNVLEKFNLQIRPGEKVGIVGSSGSGKTTMIKCLLRYFDVAKGAVEVDGHNIKDITQKSLRAAIAIIPQDISMFHRSIKDNLLVAKPDASDETIYEACRKAKIHEDILAMPLGYETLVGERGVKLSGGQRQRIAIARAILKSAPIIILDEATSSLDSNTERLIQESIDEMLGHTPATVIAIAHRLSTISTMDRIIVLEKGKIVEVGTHSQLVEHEGVYAKLWDNQSVVSSVPS